MIKFSVVQIHEIHIFIFSSSFFPGTLRTNLWTNSRSTYTGITEVRLKILASLKFFQAFFSQLTASVASATGLSLKARDWEFTPAAMSIRPSYSCRKQTEIISKTLPSCENPRLLISYFQQLEILVTALLR